MKSFEQVRRYRRIVLQLAAFAGCCGLALAIRIAVRGGTLSDPVVATLLFAGLAVFIGAVFMTFVASLGAKSRPERMAFRSVSAALAIGGALFVRSSYADASIALNAIWASDDSAQTSIVVGPGGRDIRLSGELGEGAARRLATLLDAHPKAERIHLTSEGGLADEGEALRKVIAAHGLTTFVPDYCVSACTLAFLGGKARLIMKGGRVGFHAPYDEGLFGQTFASDSSDQRAAYINAGVTPDFVDAALAVAPEDIWTPDADKLVAAHVVTGVVDRYQFPDSNLDGNVTLAGARDAVVRNFPTAKALGAKRPHAIDTIAAWYLEAYRNGLSEGQVVDGIRLRVERLGQGAPVALSMAGGER